MAGVPGWWATVVRSVQGDITRVEEVCRSSREPQKAGMQCCGHRKEGRRCETAVCKRGYPPACLATNMSRPPSLARSLTANNAGLHEGIARSRSLAEGEGKAQRCQHQTRIGPLQRG
jgi:hypothetical protein